MPMPSCPRRAFAACRSRARFAQSFSFLRLHLLSYLLLGLVGTLIIWAIEGRGASPFPFVDILFAGYSSCTLTGLTVIDLAQFRPGSRAVVTVLMFAGSPVLWSLLPVMIRRFYFRRSMDNHLAAAGLRKEERERLLNEEIEYRALSWILRIAVAHFLFWPLLVTVIIGGYLSSAPTATDLSAIPISQAQASVMVLQRQQVGIWWFSLFTAFSSYLNAGISLVVGSLKHFVSDYPILLFNAALIILGNTAFPLTMRASVVVLQRWYGDKEPAFAFLLARPRKCYTLLYNGYATLVLGLVLLATLFGEFILFFALDWNDAYLNTEFTPHIRALAGFFQSTSTRTAGYNVIDLARVDPGMQMLWVFLMYLVQYPLALAVRRTRDTAMTPILLPFSTSSAGESAEAAATEEEADNGKEGAAAAHPPPADRGGELPSSGTSSRAVSLVMRPSLSEGTAPATAPTVTATVGVAAGMTRTSRSRNDDSSARKIALAIAAAQRASGFEGNAAATAAVAAASARREGELGFFTSRRVRGGTHANANTFDAAAASKTVSGAFYGTRSTLTKEETKREGGVLTRGHGSFSGFVLAPSSSPGNKWRPGLPEAWAKQKKNGPQSSAIAAEPMLAAPSTNSKNCSAPMVVATATATTPAVDFAAGPSDTEASTPIDGESSVPTPKRTVVIDTPHHEKEKEEAPREEPRKKPRRSLTMSVLPIRKGKAGTSAVTSPQLTASPPSFALRRKGGATPGSVRPSQLIRLEAYLERELTLRVVKNELTGYSYRSSTATTAHHLTFGREDAFDALSAASASFERQDGSKNGNATARRAPPRKSALEFVVGSPIDVDISGAAVMRKLGRRKSRVRVRAKSAVNTERKRQGDDDDDDDGEGAHKEERDGALRFRPSSSCASSGGSSSSGRSVASEPGGGNSIGAGMQQLRRRLSRPGTTLEEKNGVDEEGEDEEDEGDENHSSLKGERNKRLHGGSPASRVEASPQAQEDATIWKAASSVFSREIVWLSLTLLVLVISETDFLRLTPYPREMNIFSLLFELTSAFGCVGFSLGYPLTPYSLSAQFNTFSKFLIMATMIAGRHRALPTSVDAAVFLPNLLSTVGQGLSKSANATEEEEEEEEEDEDAEMPSLPQREPAKSGGSDGASASSSRSIAAVNILPSGRTTSKKQSPPTSGASSPSRQSSSSSAAATSIGAPSSSSSSSSSASASSLAFPASSSAVTSARRRFGLPPLPPVPPVAVPPLRLEAANGPSLAV